MQSYAKFGSFVIIISVEEALEVKFKENIRKFNGIFERPLFISVSVLVLLGVIVVTLSAPFYRDDFYNFYGQVLAEAHGMLFDIAIIGILIFWLNKTAETRQRIRTYKDEIDDFRLWESEEAAYRTVGNIKRLNRHHIYSLNLVNCHLSRTNLNYVKLKGANLNSAKVTSANLIECNLENARCNQTSFENSSLNQAKLNGAYASGANFKDAYLIKTEFRSAFLIKADFTNAYLMESDLKGAYLTGANLENANLYKADFREANGITVEQFANVKSIYLAKFDPDFEEKIKAAYPEWD